MNYIIHNTHTYTRKHTDLQNTKLPRKGIKIHSIDSG